MSTDFVDETLPYWVDKFEALLKQNGGGDGWLVGDKVYTSVCLSTGRVDIVTTE